jgi:hypothetical protein
MDDALTVKADAVIYVERGSIVAVQERAMAPPAGFDEVAPVDTGGTLFPGLIELHNHLSYNALPLWSPVPKLFQDRGQWPDHPDYRKLISGPMTVVGEYRDAQGRPSLLAPLVRYVECKCLFGGVTTLQAQGVEVGLVAKLAGHKNAVVTLSHYTHAMRGGEDAVKALDQAYAGTGS